MNKLMEVLKLQMGSNINLKPIINGRIQVMLPIYYEDGDMVDIFIEPQGDNYSLISDCGMTMMKLLFRYCSVASNKCMAILGIGRTTQVR
jgi:hypothetical protein